MGRRARSASSRESSRAGSDAGATRPVVGVCRAQTSSGDAARWTSERAWRARQRRQASGVRAVLRAAAFHRRHRSHSCARRGTRGAEDDTRSRDAAQAPPVRPGHSRASPHRRSSASIATRGRSTKHSGPISSSRSTDALVRGTSRACRRHGAARPSSRPTCSTSCPTRSGSRIEKRLLETVERGGRVLVIEPIARAIAPWWDDTAARFTAVGGRADEWRLPIELPPLLQKFDRAAGLNHRELTFRSLFA